MHSWYTKRPAEQTLLWLFFAVIKQNCWRATFIPFFFRRFFVIFQDILSLSIREEVFSSVIILLHKLNRCITDLWRFNKNKTASVILQIQKLLYAERGNRKLSEWYLSICRSYHITFSSGLFKPTKWCFRSQVCAFCLKAFQFTLITWGQISLDYSV